MGHRNRLKVRSLGKKVLDLTHVEAPCTYPELMAEKRRLKQLPDPDQVQLRQMAGELAALERRTKAA